MSEPPAESILLATGLSALLGHTCLETPANATTQAAPEHDQMRAIFSFLSRFDPSEAWQSEPNPFKALALRHGGDLDQGDWLIVPETLFTSCPELRRHRTTPNVFVRKWRTYGKILLVNGSHVAAPQPVRGVCRACGCTEAEACPGGCEWAEPTLTLCTACA